MVNNFEYIKDNLFFLNEKSFYFIQILKRNKENPEQKAYSRPIESFYVFSKEQFERMMPHIIEKCEENRARAYIKMNCLDAESVMLGQIAELSRVIRNNSWHEMPSTLNSACGQCGKQNGNEKLYLVDIDDEYIDKVDEIKHFLDSMEPFTFGEQVGYDTNGVLVKEFISKIKMEVPTKHGVHLITTGFSIQKFKNTYPGIDVHEDGNTLLYYPKCCDDMDGFTKLKFGDIVGVNGNDMDDIWKKEEYTFIKYDRGLFGSTSASNKPNVLVCDVKRDDGLELRFPAKNVKLIKRNEQ